MEIDGHREFETEMQTGIERDGRIEIERQNTERDRDRDPDRNRGMHMHLHISALVSWAPISCKDI